MNTIYDTILWLKSQTTGKRFPVVVFSADTDMVTEGWVALTSIERPEIVVTQMTAEEYQSGGEPSGYLQVETRVNGVLGRSDLKCSWLVRVEETGPSGKGLSFQEFCRVSQPPRLFFRDVFNTDFLAEEDSRVSRTEFERGGGKVVVLQ
jgi:hypothetical protein